MHVHARRHSQKRLYVLEEDNPNSFINQKNDKFKQFLELSKLNINNLVKTPPDKFYEYEDLKKQLEKK